MSDEQYNNELIPYTDYNEELRRMNVKTKRV